ncbi:MAG: metallophosphoesterase [Chloroflexota bacterium]
MPTSSQQLSWYLALVLIAAIFIVSLVLWIRSPLLDEGVEQAETPNVAVANDEPSQPTSENAAATPIAATAPIEIETETETEAETPSPTATSILPTTTPTNTTTPTITPTPQPTPTLSPPYSFAIIGDFGTNSLAANKVADVIKAANVDFVVTVGDNRYGERTFDEAVGNPYCEYLANVQSGPLCDGGERSENAFFPSLGNHDYTDGLGVEEYLDYFDLPGAGIESTFTSGTERYYDIIWGPMHIFFLDSEKALFYPDDLAAQKTWLETELKKSTTPWQIVVLHDPPFSSAPGYGSATLFQWPFVEWGVEIVLAGHHHTYERVLQDGIVYFINGLSGADIYDIGIPIPGSQIQYREKAGALLVDGDNREMHFRFVTEDGDLIDTHTASLDGESAPFPQPLAAATLEVPIIHGVDDGEELMSDGEVILDSSDLELGRDDDGGAGEQLVGLRYRDLAIPQGAIIDKAYFTFRNMRPSSVDSTVSVQIEVADHAHPFLAQDYHLSSRPLSETAVSWTIPTWTEQYELVEGPEITELVQEIIDRPGWQPGNSLAFFFKGDNERALVAADGRTTRSAILHIEYHQADGS